MDFHTGILVYMYGGRFSIAMGESEEFQEGFDILVVDAHRLGWRGLFGS